jgi:hypothetical protein
VIELLVSLALAIDPANMVLVTVPVSVVYTPLVTVVALPANAPTNEVDVTLVNPANAVTVAPNATAVDPIVTLELASLALAIDPGSMMLVTVPVSVVYTPLVTVVALDALPVNAPTNEVEVTEFRPARVVELAPNDIAVEPIVTLELTNLALAIETLLNALVTSPLVKVTAPIRV